jgi:hypothetical protein
LIVEADSERFLNDTVILSPIIEDHAATSMLRESGAAAVMPRCRGVFMASRDFVENVPLYSASSKSFGKSDPLDISLNKKEGDVDGPFVLAAAAENLAGKSRVVLFGNTDFITSLNAVRFAGNLAAFMGGVVWISGQNSSVAIQPKSLVNPPLQVSSSSEAYFLLVLVIALIPSSVLFFGLAVWRRRMSM